LVPIADEVEAWAKRFYRAIRISTTLILSGDSGTGKTMISNRLRAWVERMAIECAMSGGWNRSPSTEWVDWVDWWERYQDGRPCRDLSDIINADCLFLDDVGAESDRYKSGQSTAILCQVLGKRERKFTVLTTNVSKENWAEKFDTRVSDRLKRNGAVYVSFWNIKSFNG
jgi:DNA replication protein DnaC